MEQRRCLGKSIPRAHLGQDKRGLALHWHGLGISTARRKGGKERLRVAASFPAAAILDYLFMSPASNGAGVLPGHSAH